MTLVTRERELHVLGSAAVTMRKNSTPANNIPEPSDMWGPLLLLLLLLLRNDLLACNNRNVSYRSF